MRGRSTYWRVTPTPNFFERGAYAHRISDSLPQSRFRETALYNDYYRRVGLSHVLALPLRMNGRELVSFVLNRDGMDFDDRELAPRAACVGRWPGCSTACRRPNGPPSFSMKQGWHDWA